MFCEYQRTVMVRLSHGKMIYEEVYQKKYQGIRSKGCSAWVFPVDIGCIGGPVYLASNSIMVNNRKESKSINKSLEIIMMVMLEKSGVGRDAHHIHRRTINRSIIAVHQPEDVQVYQTKRPRTSEPG